MSGAAANRRRSGRHAWMLGALVLGMFGFGFAMVPLYNLICQVAGWNNAQPAVKSEPFHSHVDTGRWVRMQFDYTRNQDLAWDIEPSLVSTRVHPGAMHEVRYRVTNRSDRTITVQAVPSVTPWQATEYLRKIECFCFASQTLAAGESAELPLRYVIDPDLPGRFSTVTLSYTFMDTGRDDTASGTAEQGSATGAAG